MKLVLISIHLLFIFPVVSVSQNLCEFIEDVHNYQDSVKTKWIDSVISLDSTTFDIDRYLGFFDHINILDGIRINIAYYYDFRRTAGLPILYAVEADKSFDEIDHIEKDTLSQIYKLPYDSIPDQFVLEVLASDPKYQIAGKIYPNDTDLGYLQYLFLMEHGDSFALYWHANYGARYIICSEEQLLKVIELLENPKIAENFQTDRKELEKLKKLDTQINITKDDNYYYINWIEFWTNHGFYRTEYQISRDVDHAIVRKNKDMILKIEIMFIY